MFKIQTLTVCAAFITALALAPAAAATKKKTTARKAAPAAAAAAAAPVVLSAEQQSIAQMVHTGTISCELGQRVSVEPNSKTQGAFDVRLGGGSSYNMVPMPTKTGAIRLEDKGRGVIFMQLANKSMMLDERNGRRLADECLSPQQQQVAERMKSQPPVDILK
jgi:hypothetical protein